MSLFYQLRSFRLSALCLLRKPDWNGDRIEPVAMSSFTWWLARDSSTFARAESFEISLCLQHSGSYSTQSLVHRLVETCVQHMLKLKQNGSHRLQRPMQTWLQTTHTHTHTHRHVLVQSPILQGRWWVVGVGDLKINPLVLFLSKSYCAFPSVCVCVCVWFGDEGYPVPVHESRTPRELRDLIKANCRDKAQQLELSYSVTPGFTGTLFLPTHQPISLQSPHSWKIEVYRSVLCNDKAFVRAYMS